MDEVPLYSAVWEGGRESRMSGSEPPEHREWQVMILLFEPCLHALSLRSDVMTSIKILSRLSTLLIKFRVQDLASSDEAVAVEREGSNVKRLEGIYLKAQARIWPELSYVCQDLVEE